MKGLGASRSTLAGNESKRAAVRVGTGLQTCGRPFVLCRKNEVG